MYQNSRNRKPKNFQRQALPIDENDDESSTDSEINFNLNEISAIKYLKHVRSEREKLPEIAIVEVPEKYRNQQIEDEESKSSQGNRRDTSGQTKEWHELQNSRFSDLQIKIADMQIDSRLDDNILVAVPFDVNCIEACVSYCKENEPKLSFMFALNQRELENLIEHLSNYFVENVDNKEFMDECSWITKWIYSSLACLRIPLDPEVHNSLRMIAKSCIQLIESSSNDDNANLFLPYNLLVTVIANNFHQFDLLSL